MSLPNTDRLNIKSVAGCRLLLSSMSVLMQAANKIWMNCFYDLRHLYETRVISTVNDQLNKVEPAKKNLAIVLKESFCCWFLNRGCKVKNQGGRFLI